MRQTKKTVLITGGTAGIGFAIAKTFAEKGYNVIISYFHNKSKATKAERILIEYGVEVLAIRADSGNRKDIVHMFKKVANELGKIDILVNNIGGTFPDRYTENEWEVMFHHHLMSTVHATQIFAEQLGKSTGCIINISSVLGIEPLLQYKGARLEAYCCMKAAINMYTKITANKFGGKIRVNCIAPGNTETEGRAHADEQFKKMRTKGMLSKRFLQPEEIAKMALHIKENEALNGQVFIVDGGVVGKGYE